MPLGRTGPACVAEPFCFGGVVRGGRVRVRVRVMKKVVVKIVKIVKMVIMM